MRSRRLSSLSFIGYLLMTFLTAVNDSMFRWMVCPIATNRFQGKTWSLGFASVKADDIVLPLGLFAFFLPFVIFAPWAGWVSDRFSKRTSIIWLKWAEVLLMVGGILAIQQNHVSSMFILLFLIGAQATLIGTSKYGIIPELVRRKDISAANGLSGVATLIGSIIGTVAGYSLADLTIANPFAGLCVAGVALVGVALAGVGGSILIEKVAAANSLVRFQWNLATDSIRDLKLVIRERGILRVSFGIVFFWSLAALAQMNIHEFVTNELSDVTPLSPGPFMAMLVIGVGIGSLLAGWWSSGRVELGMVPFGTLLMGLACILLYFCSDSPVMTGAMLIMIGVGGGLFSVPLNAYIQERSPHEKLGAILAAVQQMTAVGMLFVSGLFWMLNSPMHMTASQIFLLSGVAIIPIVVYSVWILPQATIRFFVWLLSRFVYSVRKYGIENIT